MVKVQFDIDSAGYIDGWTDAEFADQTKLRARYYGGCTNIED